MHESVVGADPDDVHVTLARRDREDRPIDLRTIHVAGDRTARRALRLGRVPREIARERRPVLPAVGRHPEPLRRHVEPFGIDRREEDREGPLPAFLDVARRLAGVEPGVRVHFARETGATIELVEVAAVVRARVEEVGVDRIGADVSWLAAAGLVRDGHAARGRIAIARTRAPGARVRRRTEPEARSVEVPVERHAERAVVLLRTTHVIRDVLGGDGVVPLRGREILRGPVATGRRRDRAAAVIRDHEMRRIGGVDPQVMEVTVRPVADRGERLALIGRPEERGVLRIDHVGILVVGEHMRVVERALTDRPVLVHQGPGRARIVALVEAALVVLDERVDTVGVRGRERDADPPDQSSREPRVARDLLPRLAAVGALEESRPRAAGRHLILLAVCLPERSVEHVGIRAIDRDVDRPRPLVTKEHATPVLAAIGRLEHATLRARHTVLAEARDVDDVRIGRVDADLGDAMRLRESDMGPVLPGISGAIHTVAGHDVAADRRLAHADVHEVGVRLTHRDRAHRCRPDLTVRDGEPGVAAVHRLPKAAAGGTEVRFVASADHAGRRDRAAAAVGPDVAPPETRQERRVEGDLRGALRGGVGRSDEADSEDR